LKLLWRFEASDEEIDAALTLVNAHQRPTLLGILQENRRDLCLWRNLVTLDVIARGDCDLTQKSLIFTILLNDFRSSKSPLYADYLKRSNSWYLGILEDLHVRFLGYAVSARDLYLEQQEIKYMTIPDPLRRPLSEYLVECRHLSANPSTIDRLLIRFWKQLDHTVSIRFVEQALLDYDKMVC
jgi:hypothetical protein